jgi:geranylgeranyl reductase family protein
VSPGAAERDVIVVGGGPAGAATACFLRQRGLDVVLLEAARFPRDKICGESISPRAWPLLERMGAAGRVRELAPHPVRGMRLTSPEGTSFEGRYPAEDAPGMAVRRLALDPVLLDRARALGAEVHEATSVTGLLRRQGAVAGVEARDAAGRRRSWGARMVVGADGRHSVVASRLLLRRLHPRLRRFAVRGYWEGVEGLAEMGEMHVGGGGYCGIAPLSPTRANVAFVLPAGEMGPAGGDLEGFYREALARRWPRLFERLEGARLMETPRAIGPLAVEVESVCAAGALLVGDAAGFYDPFTGEGVTLALCTAEMAASAIERALRGAGRRDGVAGYERERQDATRDKFRFNKALQVAVGWPGLADRMARRLARRPDLADRLVGIAGDFVPARTAFGARFLWDLLRA